MFCENRSRNLPVLAYFRVKMVVAMVVARQSPWQPYTDTTLVTRHLYSKFHDNHPELYPFWPILGQKCGNC